MPGDAFCTAVAPETVFRVCRCGATDPRISAQAQHRPTTNTQVNDLYGFAERRACHKSGDTLGV